MVEYDWSDGDASYGPQPGVYRFQVVDALEKTSQSGNKYLSLVCKQVDGNVKMFFMLHFTPKSLRITKPTLLELGVPNGLRKIEPYYFVGTVFEADCVVEKSLPNDKGRVFENLRVFTDSALPGFTMGVRLIELSHNMPADARDVPDPGDETPF